MLGMAVLGAADSLPPHRVCTCVSCAGDVPGVSTSGGRVPDGTMEVLTLTIDCHKGPRPPMTSSPIPAARSQYLLDLLAQVPDPRKKRGAGMRWPGCWPWGSRR